jgi:hypothetical protein
MLPIGMHTSILGTADSADYRRLGNGEGTLVERLGLGIAGPVTAIELAEVVEGGRGSATPAP